MAENSRKKYLKMLGQLARTVTHTKAITITNSILDLYKNGKIKHYSTAMKLITRLASVSAKDRAQATNTYNKNLLNWTKYGLSSKQAITKIKTKEISVNKIAGAFNRFRYKQSKIIDTITPIDFDKPISSIKVSLKLNQHIQIYQIHLTTKR